jgi:hypothetical protein
VQRTDRATDSAPRFIRPDDKGAMQWVVSGVRAETPVAELRRALVG